MAKKIHYEEVKLISADEALEIDEKTKKEVEEELKETFGPEELLSIHRSEMEMITEIDEHLDEYLAEYEKGKRRNREPAESIFATKAELLYRLAKRFHPLSDYGKKKLSEAARCRRDFEELVGPMITPITRENIELFQTVLSADLAEDILFERRFAIGAVRAMEDILFGVGALAYHIDESPIHPEGVLKLDWLFVHKDYRQRGIANQLVGELLGRAVETGIQAMTLEFPSNLKDKKLLGYFFGTWQFELDTEISPEAVIRLGDIEEPEKVSSYARDCRSFSALKERDFFPQIQRIWNRLEYRGYLWGVPEDYIDRELSCFVEKEGEPIGLLLCHRLPSGMIRVDELDVVPEGEEALPSLVCTFLQNAMRGEKEKTLVSLPVESEELGELLDQVIGKSLGYILVTGALFSPTDAMNLSEKDLDEWMKATA